MGMLVTSGMEAPATDWGTTPEKHPTTSAPPGTGRAVNESYAHATGE